MDQFKQVKGELIVSCQALEDEPLHSSFIMGRMAKAAYEGGAKGIRANSVSDIKEIKSIVPLPVIGIIKKQYPGTEVYITPSMNEIDALHEIGVEIIALDATDQSRPSQLAFRKPPSKTAAMMYCRRCWISRAQIPMSWRRKHGEICRPSWKTAIGKQLALYMPSRTPFP